MATREHLVRAVWTLFEPIHAVGYFSTESRQAFADIGLTRYWDGYFAGRAAPLGPVNAAPVTALFSGFSPAIVERALPAVWEAASPASALEARALGAAATLRALFPDEAAVADAAELLAAVAARVDTIGRPLAAANAALPEQSEPYRRLWQAATTLREHRGDGHVVALVTEGVPGISTIVLRSAVDLDGTAMLKSRGWAQEDWDAEVEALTARGLLAEDGTITAAGIDALNRAEHLTNRLALGPWATLDDDELLAVARAIAPVSHACSVLFPYPNPIGMPSAWLPDTDPDATAIPAVPA